MCVKSTFLYIVSIKFQHINIQEKNMKENQRTRLTKILLKQALISLLETKNIQKISIKEICEKAELNRTTFYNHYNNEYELLDDLCADALKSLIDTIHNSLPISINGMLQIIYEERDKIKKIFLNNADEKLPKLIMTIPEIQEFIRKDIPNSKSEQEIQFISNFICYGSFYIIRDWINNDCNININFLAEKILDISKKNL